MRRPIRPDDLVLDQVIDRFGIRSPQQRFGQAHQCDSLAAGQSVLNEKGLHDRSSAGCPYGVNQFDRMCDDRFPIGLCEASLASAVAHRVGLVHEECGSYGRSQFRQTAGLIKHELSSFCESSLHTWK